MGTLFDGIQCSLWETTPFLYCPEEAVVNVEGIVLRCYQYQGLVAVDPA